MPTRYCRNEPSGEYWASSPPRTASWYQVVYRIIYRLGVIIWWRPAPPVELVALVEGPSALPAECALDVGCGKGTDTVYLASHGWNVTGVDIVLKALTIARRNAIAAGVAPRLVKGDVTQVPRF